MNKLLTFSFKESPGAQTALLLFLAAGYLYVLLFFHLRVPILLSGDQVFFWSYAHRLLTGELPYRDFLQFTPPGTDLVYAGLFRVLGEEIWVTNAVVLVVGVALCWLCFQISREILAQRWAFLATALFLMPFYGGLLNATHHWFSTLAVLIAVLLLMKFRGDGAMLFAGTCLGIASFFTQTRGLFGLVGIVIWALLEACRNKEPWLARVALLGTSFALTLLLLEVPFFMRSSFQDVWFQQVTYVQRHMISRSIGLPEGFALRKLPYYTEYLIPYFLLPFIYPAALFAVWADRANPAFKNVRLLAFVGACLMCEVAVSPNYLRVYAVSMPGLILFVWWATSEIHRRKWIVLAVSCFVMAALILQLWGLWRTKYLVIKLPSGIAAVNEVYAEKLNYLAQNTKEGDWFYQPAWPGVYFPMKVRNPAFLDEVTTGYATTEPEFIERSIKQIAERRTRYVMWATRLDTAGQLAGLRSLLQQDYRLVHTFGDGDQLWERRSEPHQ